MFLLFSKTINLLHRKNSSREIIRFYFNKKIFLWEMTYTDHKSHYTHLSLQFKKKSVFRHCYKCLNTKYLQIVMSILKFIHKLEINTTYNSINKVYLFLIEKWNH